MSLLDAFLTPADELQTIEVELPRFKDEKGNPAKIVLRNITSEQNAQIQARCKKQTMVKGVPMDTLDSQAYLDNLMLAMIVEPNFAEERFVKHMGKVSPIDALKARFTIGEYNKIVEAINKLIGVSNLVEQAKN